MEFYAVAIRPLVGQWVVGSFVFRAHRLTLVGEWRIGFVRFSPLVRQGGREFSCFSKERGVGEFHGPGVFLQHGAFFLREAVGLHSPLRGECCGRFLLRDCAREVG